MGLNCGTGLKLEVIHGLLYYIVRSKDIGMKHSMEWNITRKAEIEVGCSDEE
jgi:hypothetical protein